MPPPTLDASGDIGPCAAAAGRRVRRLPVGIHGRPTAARAHRQAARHARPAAARIGRRRWTCLYALDDRIQDGVFEPASLAPVLALARRRHRLGRQRPRLRPLPHGPSARAHRTGRRGARCRRAAPRRPGRAQPSAGADDRRARARRPRRDRTGGTCRPLPDRAARSTIVRAEDQAVVVSGSGDGLVDLAAAGLLDGSELVRYSASLDGDELNDGTRRSVDDCSSPTRTVTGHATGAARRTPPGTPSPTSPSSDCCATSHPTPRLPVFADRDERGRSGDADGRPPGRAGHGDRHVVRRAVRLPARAPPVHGDRRRPGHGVDRRRARRSDRRDDAAALRASRCARSVSCRPSAPGERRITAVSVSDPVAGADATRRADRRIDHATTGQPIDVARRRHHVDITIEAVGGGTAGAPHRQSPASDSPRSSPAAADGRGRARADRRARRRRRRHAAGVRPHAAAGRSDGSLARRPRTDAVREFELPSRSHHDADAPRSASTVVHPTQALAAMFGWPAWASSRLTGSVANAGVSAIDGDRQHGVDHRLRRGARGDADDRRHRSAPIDRITVRQPAGEFSRITELVAAVAGRGALRSTSPPRPTGRRGSPIDPAAAGRHRSRS